MNEYVAKVPAQSLINADLLNKKKFELMKKGIHLRSFVSFVVFVAVDLAMILTHFFVCCMYAIVMKMKPLMNVIIKM